MNKKKLFIVITALVLVLATAGGAYYFLVLRNQDQQEEPVTCYSYEIEDSFVTNVKDSKKLFKATIILVLDTDDKEVTALLDSNKYVIRDQILFMLRELTEEDICSDTIQDKLRTDIPKALNEKLGIENIVSLYFGDFVMQ